MKKYGNLRLSKDNSVMTPKANFIKEKNGYIRFHLNERSHLSKDIIRKMKREAIHLDKIFINHITDKGPISRMQKNS